MRSFDYLKTYRGMPWIKRGMAVDMDGKRGVVTSGGTGGGVRVRFDGSGYSSLCHPHWQMTYFDTKGNVIRDYKGEQHGSH